MGGFGGGSVGVSWLPRPSGFPLTLGSRLRENDGSVQALSLRERGFLHNEKTLMENRRVGEVGAHGVIGWASSVSEGLAKGVETWL